MAIINLEGIIARNEKIQKDRAIVEKELSDKAISYIHRLQEYDGRLQDILDTLKACEKYDVPICPLIDNIPISVSTEYVSVIMNLNARATIMYIIGSETLICEYNYTLGNGDKKRDVYGVSLEDMSSIMHFQQYEVSYPNMHHVIDWFEVMLSYMDRYIEEMTERFNNI